eukprot:6229071-Amphidinium_carterae.1
MAHNSNAKWSDQLLNTGKITIIVHGASTVITFSTCSRLVWTSWEGLAQSFHFFTKHYLAGALPFLVAVP